jgi:hypothetical protein
MKKFKFDVSWLERHGGSLFVEAENKEEALALLKADENRLLELMINKYANETFDYLGEVTVVEAEIERKEDVTDLIIENESIIND